ATWLNSALMILPLINVAAFIYGPRWFWAWAAWLFAALAIVPGALLLTIVMVRAVGPRRARLGVQIGSSLVGIVAIVGAQAPHWMGTHATTSSLISSQ